MGSEKDSPTEHVSVLGPSLRFKGELHADEDLLIHGQVQGSITHSQRLTIGREGRVRADIKGQVIAVAGTVEGDLLATTSITVLETAHLTGDVRAPNISIVEGAEFNGNVTMETGKTSRSGRPADGRPAQSAEATRGTSSR